MLIRFGFDSSNFVNKPVTTIEFGNEFIYEIDEDYKIIFIECIPRQLGNQNDSSWLPSLQVEIQ